LPHESECSSSITDTSFNNFIEQDDISEEETTIGENTLEESTIGEPEPVKDRNMAADGTDDYSKLDDDDDTKSQGTYGTFDDEPDAFAITYNYCEDLMNAISAACGLSSAAPTEDDTKDPMEDTKTAAADKKVSAFDNLIQYTSGFMGQTEPVSSLPFVTISPSIACT